jgi:hypothetical protein
MKVAISLPDELFLAAETLGRRLRLSRSRLYATALAECLGKHRGKQVTDRLDAVYASEERRRAPARGRGRTDAAPPASW